MKQLTTLTRNDLNRIVEGVVRSVLGEQRGNNSSARISLELYHENGQYGIYLGDEMGGSGIEVNARTPKEAVKRISPYIVDYFYKD